MKSFGRYAFGVILLVIAIIFIVIIFNLIRGIFAGGDDPAQQPGQSAKQVDLLAVPGKDQTVQFTVSGPVTGQEEHRSIRIKVDRDTRIIEVLQGYGDVIIKSQEFPNSLEAYEAFIAALNGAGFASNVPPAGRGDEAQSCPTGRKFSYAIDPGTSQSFRTWSNSCSAAKQGTFSGNASLVQQLFQKQIPEYNKFTSDVRLG